MFASKEYATAENRPYLNITYSDVPDDPPSVTLSMTKQFFKYIEAFQINATVTDDIGISSIWYADNTTGAISNKTSVNYTAGITSVIWNYNFSSSVADGNYTATFTSNDSIGQSVQVSIAFAIDSTPPIVLRNNLTSEGGDGQIIYDANGSTITHLKGEPSNLPDNGAYYDGINMSGNQLLLHFIANSTSDTSGVGNNGIAYGSANSPSPTATMRLRTSCRFCRERRRSASSTTTPGGGRG